MEEVGLLTDQMLLAHHVSSYQVGFLSPIECSAIDPDPQSTWIHIDFDRLEPDPPTRCSSPITSPVIRWALTHRMQCLGSGLILDGWIRIQKSNKDPKKGKKVLEILSFEVLDVLF
jgi:hypothetical protein